MANRRPKRGWHPEDIRAELRKRGHTWSSIGRKLGGYQRADTPSKVLRQRWPWMEKIVADLLGVSPSEIWPERYRLDGSPAGRGARKAYPNLRAYGNGKAAGAA